MTYSQFGCCGNRQISANYVVDNLVMCENRVNTHTHTHTHTFSSRVFYRKYLKCQRISNSFLHNFGCGSALLEQVPYCVHLAQISPVLLTVSSDLYLRNGAPPLRVAAPKALHHHITALSVGTYRAISETPYFHFNY